MRYSCLVALDANNFFPKNKEATLKRIQRGFYNSTLIKVLLIYFTVKRLVEAPLSVLAVIMYIPAANLLTSMF